MPKGPTSLPAPLPSAEKGPTSLPVPRFLPPGVGDTQGATHLSLSQCLHLAFRQVGQPWPTMAKLQIGSPHPGKGAPGQTGVQGRTPQELGRSAPDLSPAAGGACAVAASLQSSQEFFLSACWVHIPLLIRTPVLSHHFGRTIPYLHNVTTLFPNEFRVGGTGGQQINKEF